MNLLGLAIFCVAVLTRLTAVQCYAFPSFQSLYEIFGQSTDYSEDAVHERVKRQRSGGDECSEAYLSCGGTLPMVGDQINFRYMPALANGHLGFVPYRPYIHMKGLYSGRGGQSHRAKLPNLIMGKISLPTEELNNRAVRKYQFNAKEGTFTETIDSEFADITHTMYVHQKYNTLFISNIYLKRKPDIPGGGSVSLNYTVTPETLQAHSPDIIFERPENRYANVKIRGRIRESEDGDPANRQYVHLLHTNPIGEISIYGRDKNETMIMAFDHKDATATSEFDIALRIMAEEEGSYKLLQSHIEEWRKTWEAGSIEVEGNSLMTKLANFAMYSVLSNLPALEPQHGNPQDQYHFGVARSGLAHGSAGVNHQGHVMWDSELYVLPAVLPFHPELAKRMLRYRTMLFEQALANAEERGEVGARYPWESSVTGRDVTPENTCGGCAERQIHVSGAVAFGIRQYFSLTRDEGFLKDQYYKPCDVMREIARFYAGKAQWRSKTARYQLYDVMGPDDHFDHVNNNAYTNVVASLAIHYARYLACMCGSAERTEVPDDWIQVAMYLALPYNNKRRRHDQFDGYDRLESNYTIKQADALLLGYPLNWNMSRDIMKNDLEFFEDRISSDTPAMTYGFMAVAWKFAEDRSKMETAFEKSYADYMKQPFKVWTEYNEGSLRDTVRSTVNFMPGQGAFLQSLVYGFAGVRIRPEKLEFHNPEPPPGCRSIKLKGFNYMNGEFDVTIDRDQRVRIEVTRSDSGRGLVLQRNNSHVQESLNRGDVIDIDNGGAGFFIFSREGTSCEHPRDYIYMPWGYSPWISAAPGDVRADVTHVLFMSLVAFVMSHLQNRLSHSEL